MTKGHEELAAAREILEDSRNSENPELYAVFPFRIFGLGQPDLDVARHSFNDRTNRGAFCWQQSDIQAAYLGLTDAAGSLVRDRAGNSEFRFPVFWGPNNDWMPDQDHGAHS